MDIQTIGRYRIQGELGKGAMGVVYRALDPAIGRTVAIKTIRLANFDDPRERAHLRERLFREAQSAGILSHPHIVTIYDIAEEAGNAYIFMEFVDGPTLHQEMSQAPALEPRFVLGLLQQCASALDYAHRKGIVHRDIKPANLMIAEGEIAKVTDFGIARIGSQQFTQSGVILGTPNYMSPEQFSGADVTGQSDQFSLAVIAYELLTGEKPFVAESLPTLMYRIIRDEATPPHRINASLGPAVDTVIARAMAKASGDRYPTCTEFIGALAQACAATPDWQPMLAGASRALPTVLEPSPAAPPDQAVPEPPTLPPSPPAERPPLAVILAPAAAAVPAAPAAPAAPTDLPPPVPVELPPPAPLELPPPARSARDYQEPAPGGHRLGRNLVLTALLTAVVGSGLMYLIWSRKQARPPAQVAQQQQQQQPETLPTASDKPSPTGPPQKTPASPAEAPAATTPAPGPETEKPAEPAEPPTATDKPAQPAPPTHVEKTTRPVVEHAPHPPAPGDLVLTVTTNPPGARVVFDNLADQACTAPCNFTLRGGRHSLAAALDGYRSGLRIFELPKDRNLFVSLDKQQGTLRVTTDPPGASILLNGQRWAQPTPTTLTLAPGKYRIEFTREGYMDYADEVTVRDQAIARLEITLAKKP